MELYPYQFEMHAKQREVQVRKQIADAWKYGSLEIRNAQKSSVNVFKWFRKVKHA